ncbi:MAG: hypothetical protein KJ734_06265, partial [Chloroflexi bacterium]|nr:hypothetical protein [Chloroflexota bacterium]
MLARRKNPVWAGLAVLGLLWLVMLGLSGRVWAGSPTYAESGSSPPASLQSQGVIPPASSFLLYSREDNTIWLKDETGDAKLMDGARPRLSPDGRYIVYEDEAIFGDLYVRDLQTSQVTRVYTNTNKPLLVAAWMGDGSRFVFDYDCGIYAIDRDGSNLETLIDSWPATYRCYNDSPDSNPVDGRLAWENEKYGLGVAEADGSNPGWVPNTQPYDYSPRWSPDGQWIAFWRDNDVYKIRPDGTGLTQLTFLAAAGDWMEESGPWVTDGQYLVAPGTVDGVDGLYAVPSDGSGSDEESGVQREIPRSNTGV